MRIAPSGILLEIAHARTLLPVPVRGLDSDNGGEFINHHLDRYREREKITFTRCRPYKALRCRIDTVSADADRTAGEERGERAVA